MKISELVNDLILEAATKQVSDIHFHPLKEKVEIYFRLANKLKYKMEIHPTKYSKLLRYIKFKARLDLSLSRTPQDGSFEYYAEDDLIFLRVSTIPLMSGESLVLRLINESTQYDFASLSYYPEDLENIYQTIKGKNGLYVFTGPTGSGKTTSMYSILNRLAIQDKKKIITIENPIEIVNHNFVQMQINQEMGISYSVALRASLRQDPDVIMIGEIRDEETARNVFRAGLTGHTVITTMHTKNKYGVIERFLDYGFLISEIESVLIGVSNQRLIKNHQQQIRSFYDYASSREIKEMIETKGETFDIEAKINALKTPKKL